MFTLAIFSWGGEIEEVLSPRDFTEQSNNAYLCKKIQELSLRRIVLILLERVYLKLRQLLDGETINNSSKNAKE